MSIFTVECIHTEPYATVVRHMFCSSGAIEHYVLVVLSRDAPVTLVRLS